MQISKRLERLEATNQTAQGPDTTEGRWQKIWREQINQSLACPHPASTLSIYAKSAVGSPPFTKPYYVTVHCLVCGYSTPIWKGITPTSADALYLEAYYGAHGEDFERLAAQLVSAGEVEQVVMPDDWIERAGLEKMIREEITKELIPQEGLGYEH